MIALEFGWNKKYIVKSADALKIIELLERAEMYEDVWRKPEDGGTTYHVWGSAPEDLPSLKIVGDSTYQMAKLAGKPEKK